MANISTSAILTRMREVIDGDVTASCAIPAGTFGGSLPPGIGDTEASRRAMNVPRYDVRLLGVEPHPSRPPNADSLGLYVVRVAVAVIQHVYLDRAINDDERHSYYAALATQYGDMLTQALIYPGNLHRVFATGLDTGLVGGCLRSDGIRVIRFEMPGQGPGLIESEHDFWGVIAVDR